MVYHGNTVVAAAGTAVPLTTASHKASWVTIFPRKASGTANTGEVRVGGKPDLAENGGTPGVTKNIPSGSGMPLSPGDAGVFWPMMGPNPLDTSTIYVDADTNEDGVQWIYGRL